MCLNPYIVKPNWRENLCIESNFVIAPCGKCDACLIKLGRLWAHRIELEIEWFKGKAAYVTLTLNDDHNDGNLHKEHIQAYIKRLRKNLGGREIKYFAVGEYGPQLLRPHYHLIIINVDGHDHYDQLSRLKLKEKIIETRDDWYWLHRSWRGQGYTDIQAPRTAGAYQYITGYINKIAKNKEAVQEKGLNPEFRLMSKALGKRQVKHIAITLLRKYLGKTDMPVITYLSHGKYKKPLGRYLSSYINRLLGSEDNWIKQKVRYCHDQFIKYSKGGVENLYLNYVNDQELQLRFKNMIYRHKLRYG